MLAATAQTGKANLAGHLRGLLKELARLTNRAQAEGDIQSVHHARVCTRRLSAALQVLSPVLGRNPRHLAKTLRKTRRSLGELRDIDVQLSHLREITGAAHKAALAWALQQLKQRRQRLWCQVRKQRFARHRKQWRRVWQQLESAPRQARTCLAQSLRKQLASFTSLADALSPAASPHALRIAGKSLRYTIELSAAAGSRLPPGLLPTFKQMQDLLGLWHDYVVLADTLMELAPNEQLALTNPKLAQQVLALANLLLHRGQLELDKFKRLWKLQRRRIDAPVLQLSATA